MNTLTGNNTYGEQTSFDGISVVDSAGQLGMVFIGNSTSESSVQCAGGDWKYANTDGNEYTTTDTSKLRTIVLETDQQVSPEFYNWAITQGNLVKVEETTGETWVLNSSLNLTNFSNSKINFTSAGVSYIGLYSIEDMITEKPHLNYVQTYNPKIDIPDLSTQVYANATWVDGKYRTITFDSPVTDSILLTWLQANGTKQGGQTKTFTLPTALELGGGTNPISVDGMLVSQGNIEVSSGVYQALTNLNNGGSLTDFGNSCGLTISSEMLKMFKMGMKIEKNPSSGEPEQTENGKYKLTATIPTFSNLSWTNIHVLEYDYTNNTAEYIAIEAENIDPENHTITFTVNKIDGSTLVIFDYSMGTTAHTLTIEEQFSYGDNITVNGNSVTSPYTLQNGDVIKVPTTNSTTTINGTSYSIRDESVLNINNQDIVISRTGPEKVVSPVPYITINYTE